MRGVCLQRSCAGACDITLQVPRFSSFQKSRLFWSSGSDQEDNTYSITFLPKAIRNLRGGCRCQVLCSDTCEDTLVSFLLSRTAHQIELGWCRIFPKIASWSNTILHDDLYDVVPKTTEGGRNHVLMCFVKPRDEPLICC